MAIIIEYTNAAKEALANGADITDMYAHVGVRCGGDANHSKEYAGIMPTEWFYSMSGTDGVYGDIKGNAEYMSDEKCASGLVTVAKDAEDLLHFELEFVEQGEPIYRALETILRDACGYDLQEVVVGHTPNPKPRVIYATQEQLGNDADEFDARALHMAAYEATEGYGYHISKIDYNELYNKLGCMSLANELREEANNC